jgi:hypothetical protein
LVKLMFNTKVKIDKYFNVRRARIAEYSEKKIISFSRSYLSIEPKYGHIFAYPTRIDLSTSILASMLIFPIRIRQLLLPKLGFNGNRIS